MNQIIQTPNKDKQRYKEETIKTKKVFAKFFKTYFVVSTLIMVLSSVYYFNRLSNINKNEKLSQILINNYGVSRLYSNNQNSPSAHLSNGDSFSVIGILQIDKINLKYPILSNISDYLLQIAPCRFYGPLPNEVRKFMRCLSQL